MAATLDDLLDRLERLKRSFNEKDGSRAEKILVQLGRRRLPDTVSLIRFHEILLFMRAYPYNGAIRRRAEQLLSTFHLRVAQLHEAGTEDVDALVEPEVSGIAGTRFSVDWSYTIIRHLAAHHSSEVEIDWDGYRDDALMVDLLKVFLPLFEDGAYVEYPVPYLEWIRAAKKRDQRDLGWLLRRVEGLPIPERLEGALFDALKLRIQWKLGDSVSSRTRMRLPTKKIFYHKKPLIGRSEVSLAQVLEDSTPFPMRRLSPAEGRRVLSLGRDAMTVRLRELYGFTHGDPEHVVAADVGRGVELFIWGVPPARRFPMIGYHAALISKNGVPTGYAESLSLLERTEFGLNLFYTFRDGESAWIYARLLRLFRQFLGVSVFSVDPYQIGFHNEEAIESGAFWFYRKLGFRPIRPELLKITQNEERKIERRRGYRTPLRIIRKLATGHLIYEAPSSPSAGDWDRFRLRHLGLAVQRRMAQRYDGDRVAMVSEAGASVARALGARPTRWNEAQRRAFMELAPVLDLLPGLPRWSRAERRDVIRIVLAKAGAEESEYVRSLQRHLKLRAEILRLGSRAPRTLE